MSRLPRVTAKQAEKIIKQLGFELQRQSGSHKIFWNGLTRKRITLPYHGHSILHPKIVTSIIRDCEIEVSEFIDLL